MNADNPERMSLYLEHVLTEARGKTLTETVNRLRELHGPLIKRFGHDVENNTAIAKVDIPNYSKEATSKPIDSLQGPSTKQERNEILWSYVTRIEDLIKLKRRIEIESKNQSHVERANNDPVHEIETSKQEDTVDKSIQDSDWPPLNAHEIKQHYPKDVKLCDAESVLENAGRWALDPQRHDQRLKAIELRVTEWLIDHVLDVPSEDKKALYKKVHKLFSKDQKIKENALKFFKCIIRQDRKDKQAWITRAGHYVANATPFTHDKLQTAKKELVGILEDKPARYERIKRKSLQFHELSWFEKIGKREGGYRYEGIHKSERDYLAKEIAFQENLKQLEQKDQDIRARYSEKIEKFNNIANDLQKQLDNKQITGDVAIFQMLISATSLAVDMGVDQQIITANIASLLEKQTKVIKDGQEKAGNKANTMIGIQSGVVTGVWLGLMTAIVNVIEGSKHVAAAHRVPHGLV